MAQIVSIETKDTCCFTARRSVENSLPARPGHAALHPLHIKVTKLQSQICCSIESSLCPESFSVLYPGRMASIAHRIVNAMLLPINQLPAASQAGHKALLFAELSKLVKGHRHAEDALSVSDKFTEMLW